MKTFRVLTPTISVYSPISRLAIWNHPGTKEIRLKNSTRWLRISYWVGAIVDGAVAAMMLSQTFLGRPSPLMSYLPEVPYRYAMGLAGSLMLGWTILLLWSDRSPVERRGVLIITNVVILGLIGSVLYAVSVEFMSLAAAGPLLAFQAFLIVLFASSYVASVRSDVEIGRERP